MKNKIVLSLLCAAMTTTIACSKKALSELAANEDQNSSGGGSSGGSGGGSGGSGGSTSAPSALYMMNINANFGSNAGGILKYDTAAKTFTDLNIQNSTSQLYAAAINNNSSMNLGMNAFHSSDPGNYLVRNDSGTYSVHYFDYSSNTLTNTNVTVSSSSRYIAFSGGYGMTSNLSQSSATYILNGSTATNADTFLGLDGTNESIIANGNYYGLGKGLFAVTSIPSGQSVSDKILIFNASNPSTIERITTDQVILTVMRYSDTSALVATGNTAGDRAVYFVKYSPLTVTKILDYPVSGDDVTLSLAAHQDSSQDYYVIVRNTTLNKHSLIKVNHTTGAISTAAEEDATNLTNSMFDCTLSTANYNRSNGTIGNTMFNNSKMYYTCKTSSKVYLIETDFTNQTMTTYILNNSDPNYSYLFKYKDELYATVSGSSFSQITLSGGNLTLSSTTSNTLMTDLTASCNANFTGADCSSLSLVGNMIAPATGISAPFMNALPMMIQASVNVSSNPTFAVFTLSESEVSISGTLRADTQEHTNQDMFTIIMEHYATCLKIPMFM